MSDRTVLRVPVEYGEVPDHVGLFKDRHLWKSEYVILDCCKNISRIAREIEIEVVDLGFVHEYDDVVRELDALGLRPAIYPELTSFIRRYPDTHSNYRLWNGVDLAAIGSYVRYGSVTRHHPAYQEDPDSGCWYLAWPSGFGYRDGSKVVYDRFLAVKKDA